jgi:hypothetical protein
MKVDQHFEGPSSSSSQKARRQKLRMHRSLRFTVQFGGPWKRKEKVPSKRLCLSTTLHANAPQTSESSMSANILTTSGNTMLPFSMHLELEGRTYVLY